MSDQIVYDVGSLLKGELAGIYHYTSFSIVIAEHGADLRKRVLQG